MARREVTVPDLGEFKNVEIVELLVKAGDTVRAEQPLLTLETDKAAMEVPAPAAGKVLEIKVVPGGRVSQGDLILVMEAEESAALEAKKPAVPSSPPREAAPLVAASSPPPKASAPAPQARSLPPINETTFASAHASPSVRKFARELGVDLGRVTGAGQKGRVLIEDVKVYVKSVMSGAASPGPSLPRVPVVEFEKFGPVEIKPLSRVRKISGPDRKSVV